MRSGTGTQWLWRWGIESEAKMSTNKFGCEKMRVALRRYRELVLSIYIE